MVKLPLTSWLRTWRKQPLPCGRERRLLTATMSTPLYLYFPSPRRRLLLVSNWAQRYGWFNGGSEEGKTIASTANPNYGRSFTPSPAPFRRYQRQLSLAIALPVRSPAAVYWRSRVSMRAAIWTASVVVCVILVLSVAAPAMAQEAGESTPTTTDSETPAQNQAIEDGTIRSCGNIRTRALIERESCQCES